MMLDKLASIKVLLPDLSVDLPKNVMTRPTPTLILITWSVFVCSASCLGLVT